jgi:hypothetical protein
MQEIDGVHVLDRDVPFAEPLTAVLGARDRGADLADVVVSLVDRAAMALSAEGDGGGDAGDTATDDGDIERTESGARFSVDHDGVARAEGRNKAR